MREKYTIKNYNEFMLSVGKIAINTEAIYNFLERTVFGVKEDEIRTDSQLSEYFKIIDNKKKIIDWIEDEIDFLAYIKGLLKKI